MVIIHSKFRKNPFIPFLVIFITGRQTDKLTDKHTHRHRIKNIISFQTSLAEVMKAFTELHNIATSDKAKLLFKAIGATFATCY